MGSFTEYDHVWKLDVRGLGRDVIIGIIGIICVLRAAVSGPLKHIPAFVIYMTSHASCHTIEEMPARISVRE